MAAALLAGVFVATLGAVIAVTTASGSTAAPGPVGADGLSASALRSAHGLADTMGSLGTLLGVIALGVFAANVAGEYSNGTLRNLVLNQPRRLTALGGKVATLLTTTALGTVVAAGIATAAAALAAYATGVSTAAWWTAEGWQHTAGAVANLTIAGIGWGLLGAALALVLRSPVAAIAVGVAYALPFETIASAIGSGVQAWLPGRLLGAIAAGGNTTASYGVALARIAIYLTVAAVPLAVRFARSDVST